MVPGWCPAHHGDGCDLGCLPDEEMSAQEQPENVSKVPQPVGAAAGGGT